MVRFLRLRALSDGACEAHRDIQAPLNLPACLGVRVVVRRTFAELEIDGDSSEDPFDCLDREPLPENKERWSDDESTCTSGGAWSDPGEHSSDSASCEGIDTPLTHCDAPVIAATVRRSQPIYLAPCIGFDYSSNDSSTSPTHEQDEQRVGDHSCIPSSQTAFPAVPKALQTTVVIKQLSLSCTGEKLSELLDAEGFKGDYDFVYVPWELEKRVAHGFGFVNMVSHEAALQVMALLEGSTRWFGDTSALHVRWSNPHQGLEAQIAKYINSPIMHSSVDKSFKPMLFRDGIQRPFPAPTNAIEPPQIGRAARRRTKVRR